jgi:hypothetical protein
MPEISSDLISKKMGYLPQILISFYRKQLAKVFTLGLRQLFQGMKTL